eukprot:jgi/Bigna1/69287/fgenesh1_pg.8_\
MTDPSKFPGPFSKTKILATVLLVGPASESFEMLEQLWLSGVDIFRINLSHGSHDKHRQVVQNIRGIEEKYKKYMCSIGILLDLQGPKLRIGQFKGGQKIQLEKGGRFRLDLCEELGDHTRVCLPHPEIFSALRPDTSLLLDDGKVRLRVLQCGADFAETEVVVPGAISERKGVNVPDVTLPISALTEKDKKDALFGVDAGVDWIALSFVQKAADVAELRQIVVDHVSEEYKGKNKRPPKIMAKIEKPAAVSDFNKISEEVDGIMVARGDLGVELSPHQVPVVQKRLVSHMRRVGKPVVVATQMLESMITCPTPTRAEASDVANAIYDGADAVMLSAESAVGSYPVEAVSTMESIITEVEMSPEYGNRMENDGNRVIPKIEDAMIPAARKVARDIGASCIVCFTRTGENAQRLSQERSTRPIVALSNSRTTARLLAISWGVYPIYTGCIRNFHKREKNVTESDDDSYDNRTNFDEVQELAREVAFQKGLATTGDLIVVTGYQPGGAPGANVIRVLQIKEEPSCR